MYDDLRRELQDNSKVEDTFSQNHLGLVCQSQWTLLSGQQSSLVTSIHTLKTSKETYHFFRATLTKIHAVKINQYLATQISFNTPYISVISEKSQAFSHMSKKQTLNLGEISFTKWEILTSKEYARNCSLSDALSELHGGSPFRKLQSVSIHFNFNSG